MYYLWVGRVFLLSLTTLNDYLPKGSSRIFVTTLTGNILIASHRVFSVTIPLLHFVTIQRIH